MPIVLFYGHVLIYRFYIGSRIAAEQPAFLADHDYPHVEVHIQRSCYDVLSVQPVVYDAGADRESI